VGLNGSLSWEPDYFGRTVGASLGAELADKMVSPYLSYNFGFDVLGRADTPFKTFHQNLFKHIIDVGSSFVVDAESILVAGGTVQLESGDASKPYRHVPMFAPEVVDDIGVGASPELVAAARLRDISPPLEQLPDKRQRYGLLLRFAHRFENLTLRASERGYLDSWSQWASSTDARLYWDFHNASAKAGEAQQFPMLTLGPHARFHVQGPVSFWQRAYVAYPTTNGVAVPRYRTGDRELGPLWALTVGVGLRAKLNETLSLGTRVEGVYTRFLDHLYLFDRWGLFTVSTLEIEID
jgi:hypothetical protein